MPETATVEEKKPWKKKWGSDLLKEVHQAHLERMKAIQLGEEYEYEDHKTSFSKNDIEKYYNWQAETETSMGEVSHRHSELERKLRDSPIHRDVNDKQSLVEYTRKLAGMIKSEDPDIHHLAQEGTADDWVYNSLINMLNLGEKDPSQGRHIIGEFFKSVKDKDQEGIDGFFDFLKGQFAQKELSDQRMQILNKYWAPMDDDERERISAVHHKFRYLTRQDETPADHYTTKDHIETKMLQDHAQYMKDKQNALFHHVRKKREKENT